MRPFLRPALRAAKVTVATDDTSPIGHLIESVGIPLTEVGHIVADGTQVAASYLAPDEAVVVLHEISRPQRLPAGTRGFVLDVHLGALARRLRVVGIDTAYRNDADDDELIDRANAEHRVLLTRDRRLLMRRPVWCAGYVHGEHPDRQLADVIDRFAPTLAPWTRCPACNGELQPASKDDVAHLLRPGTRRTYTTFAQCTLCGKVYWRGAHAERLEEIVAHARTGDHRPKR